MYKQCFKAFFVVMNSCECYKSISREQGIYPINIYVFGLITVTLRVTHRYDKIIST